MKSEFEVKEKIALYENEIAAVEQKAKQLELDLENKKGKRKLHMQQLEELYGLLDSTRATLRVLKWFLE